ncbi:hypothetical protein [Streptomyces kebangsaanensis]|uniref:hypothetical protein n=1 Tax=Streptomyces kebangsaanensis TaxID=864058 RepID=UPI00093E1B33|nr:hypothetical protein [Streptomyces kebangsaanensis]
MTNTPTTPTAASHALPAPGVLARTYALALVVYTPLLALLLVPRLMRSRAGSEAMLAVGSVLLLTLVVGAVVIAPEVSAKAAPRGDLWSFGRARARVRTLIRTRRRTYFLCLGEFVVLYLAAQGAGGILAWMMPYVWENPAHETDPTQSLWILDYPNYAAQAITIYLVTCSALTWYATRLRALSLSLSE